MRMKVVYVVLGAVLCLWALIAGATDSGGAQAPWTSGTSTITRTMNEEPRWYWVVVLPDTQNVSVLFTADSVQWTWPVRANEVLSMPVYAESYSVIRIVATDGVDYFTKVK